MQNYTRLKLACNTTNVSMSIVICLSPLLFITFRETYGISYSMLGLLVVINFLTQLAVDLIFSFFSHKFNIPKCVKLTPILTFVGLWIYALVPLFAPSHALVGIIIGTIIFSASGGLNEVLMSPVIAAIPSDNPEREMSKLHSTYAWGVVGMIIVSSLYIYLIGTEHWHYLAIGLSAVPLLSIILFAGTTIPKMETPEKVSGALKLMKDKKLWLCFFAIFLGGAAENTMSQWCSGYIEQSLGIDKLWGDIFGLALFAFMLGVGRTLYAKIGKNIYIVLLLGGIGATACYLIAALSPIPILGLVACALTGLCVSMLWPGSLIVGQEKIPHGGVFMFAMMASGGDMGSAIAPQLVGIVTDAVAQSSSLINLANSLNITMEQLGMKAGMMFGTIFPLVSIIIYFVIWRQSKQKYTLID
ncbi:MAG: MFS transporter [Clostridia bacterium]|nr:MFS transporter [Clostridia bacterium]